jgi:hypothetical protein
MIRLIGTRLTGMREQVDTAADVQKASRLAALYLTDPKDNWSCIQYWDEAPQCRGWMTRERALKGKR